MVNRATVERLFRNRIEILAFLFSLAGAFSMMLIPVLTFASSYAFVAGGCPCRGLIGPRGYPLDVLQLTVSAWMLGAVVAVGAVALHALLPRSRRAASSFLVFAALVYWSGFFNLEVVRFWFRLDPIYFAWPPALALAGAFLTWISSAGSLTRAFWLSFTGGFLMLSLALPPLAILWGDLKTLFFPALFLGVSTMVFGEVLTMMASLSLAVFPLSKRFAGTLSMWGFFYYILGVFVLLSRAGVSPDGFFGPAESQVFMFAALGIVFSLPALATRLTVFRTE